MFENVTITRTQREAIQIGSSASGYNPEVIINHVTFDTIATRAGYNYRVINLGAGNIDVTNATIKNCILSNQMGNHSNSVSLYGTSTISYCDTFNVRPVSTSGSATIGLGMLDVDPMYTDPANNDYRLATASLCRNSAIVFPTVGSPTTSGGSFRS